MPGIRPEMPQPAKNDAKRSQIVSQTLNITEISDEGGLQTAYFRSLLVTLWRYRLNSRCAIDQHARV